MALPDGRVIVAGATEFIDINTTEAGPNDAEIYDPKTNTWVSTSLMPRRAWSVTLSQLQNGKVLLTHRELKPKRETFAQIYDPESDVWTITKSPAWSYFLADATTLDNGKVLLVGGLLTDLPPFSELYDPGDPLGSPCSTGDDCESGFCAQGVCCDRACDGGQCEACSIARGAPADGVCSELKGAACDDGDPCSLHDVCGAGGLCSGVPRQCEPLNECHEVGACDPATGLCLSPPKADGSSCEGGGVCSEGRCSVIESPTSGGTPLLPQPAAPASCSCRTPAAPSREAPAAFALLLFAVSLRRAPPSRSCRRGRPARS
jgi:hypothetical protein